MPAETDRTVAHAASEAGASLQSLAALLDAAGWKPDGYENTDIREMGATLTGMAMRAAMSAGDTDLLSGLVGRPMVEMSAPVAVLDPSAMDVVTIAPTETGWEETSRVRVTRPPDTEVPLDDDGDNDEIPEEGAEK